MINLGEFDITHDGYKAAFRCKKCPKNNTALGCPVWWEVVYVEPTKDEKKTLRGCGLQLTAEYMVQMIKAANRPAEQINQMKNELMRSVKGALSVQAGILEVIHERNKGNGEATDQIPFIDG